MIVMQHTGYLRNLKFHLMEIFVRLAKPKKKIILKEHLECIKACFWDKIEKYGQKKLPFEWKPFDFKYIPIELISEIYEEFLTEIKGDEEKSKDGIYYTPHVLVEFIL